MASFLALLLCQLVLAMDIAFRGYAVRPGGGLEPTTDEVVWIR
jgi:hypothetical protein